MVADYPIILTTYHLALASVMTQIMARWTSVLDGRHKIKMTPQVYVRAIVPIGVTFSLSLICGNLTYLYLSVAFIQMLKVHLPSPLPHLSTPRGTNTSQATTPVAVLLSGWLLGVSRPDLKVFVNVSIIVFGVVLASIGEIDFVLKGVLFQIGGVVFEALRLSMVQRILSAEYKMDALVSIYYYAPICALLNFLVALVFEIPKVTMEEVYHVGIPVFAVNGMIAFLLNFAAVSLVSKPSPPVPFLTPSLASFLNSALDRQNLRGGPHSLRRPKGHTPRRRLHAHLGHQGQPSPGLWLLHCPRGYRLLQARLQHRAKPPF